jgi:hypothetical protein
MTTPFLFQLLYRASKSPLKHGDDIKVLLLVAMLLSLFMINFDIVMARLIFQARRATTGNHQKELIFEKATCLPSA